MNRVRYFLLLAQVATLAVFLNAAVTQAEFMTGFVGSTQFADNGTSDAVVNFAVYDNTNGGDWRTELGVSNVVAGVAGNVTGNERYVYFYQVVNNDPVDPESKLENFRVWYGSGGVYAGGGHLTDRVFNEDGVGAVNINNAFLGSNDDFLDDDDVDGVPGQTGDFLDDDDVTDFVVVDNSDNALAPVLLSLETDDVSAEFDFNNFGEGKIKRYQHSVVMFLVSDLTPSFGRGETQDGSMSDGDVAMHSPLPSSVILFSLGLGGLGGWQLFRRKKKKVA